MPDGNLRERLRPLWQTHPPVALVVRASPEACLQTLIVAARPNQQRLHLRDLYAGGRRYYVQPRQDGFRLTSDTRLIWGSRRQRSRMAAVIEGLLSDADDVTFVRLRARMSIPYSLSALLIPAFVTSILIYTPWPVALISALALLLFSFSWLGHRFDAAYQANEMVYFVQKALEDLPPAEVPLLQPTSPNVVMQTASNDFREEWQKFYREHVENEQ